jgi:hypothetical protein
MPYPQKKMFYQIKGAVRWPVHLLGSKSQIFYFSHIKDLELLLTGYATKKSTNDALSLKCDQSNYFVFNNFCNEVAFSV